MTSTRCTPSASLMRLRKPTELASASEAYNAECRMKARTNNVRGYEGTKVPFECGRRTCDHGRQDYRPQDYRPRDHGPLKCGLPGGRPNAEWTRTRGVGRCDGTKVCVECGGE